MTRVVAASCLLAAAGLACSYDWSVAPPDAAAADATAESGVDAASLDATVDAAPAMDVATMDTAPPDCTTLAAAVRADLPKAKACGAPLAQACQVVVKDECGCDQVLGNASANDVTAYSDAVTAFRNASCMAPPYCVACGTANKGLCVVDNPDAGTFHCSQ